MDKADLKVRLNGIVLRQADRPGDGTFHAGTGAFRKALATDARFTVARVDLARALIAGGRYEEARRELQSVIAERAPTLIADWTVKDLPRARALLESIKDKK
mgnify:CR=1 FL=1